ncbi:MAG: hypothetical protein H0X34_20320 [Chthoniobacterales bacterium]|nr:hypothetical protein [Chthoniobacterales bacterium]
MSLKRSDKNTNGNGASADAGGDSPKLRDNVEINTKIDAYIQANPKEWNYIQSLPRERVERMLVLQNVNKLERRERVRNSVMKQLEANPELKEAYRKLVKNLPAEQQEKAMASIAARTLRTVAPRQQQSQGARV